MITININPIAFPIGPFNIAWYGIFVVLAILTVILWAFWQVRRGARVSYDTIINMAVVGIPSGVVFSRLLHVLDQWSYYSQHLGEIIGGSGLTIWGAVLGAALGVWIYSRIRKIQFGYIADMLAPGIILAQAIGRVGCTINGCCYGVETDIFCAVVYTNQGTLAPLGVAVHPTQIYEIVYNLMVFGTLLKLRGKLTPDGSLFLIYLSLYSVWRIGIGFLREGTPLIFGLQEAQVIGILVLAVSVLWLSLRARLVKPAATTT